MQTEIALAVGVVTVALAIIKVVDHLVRKRIDTAITEELRNIGKKLDDVGTTAQKIFDMHNRFGPDGVTPRWYVPQEWGEHLKVTMKACQELHTIHQHMAVTVERIERERLRSIIAPTTPPPKKGR